MKSFLLLLSLASADPADLTPVDTNTTGQPDVVLTDDYQGLAEAAGSVLKASSNYKAVGGLVIAAAAIAFLVRLSKLGAIGRLLEARNWGWSRPIIAAVLGGASTALAALQGGQQVLPALLGGIFAGLAGTGLHELGRAALPSERNRPRVNGDEIDHAVPILEEAAKRAIFKQGAGITALDTALAEASKLSPVKRLERLAALATNPAAAAETKPK